MQASAKTVADFWLAIQRDAVSGCWIWMGSRLEGPEMRTMCDGRHWVVSRLAYALTYEPLPRSTHLIRACANPRCCNPDHHVAGGSTRPSLTPDEFWARVDKSGGDDACWPYFRRHISDGYGQIEFERAVWLTHRLAFALTRGKIPDGLKVLHRCDNPPCCNPGHLFLGTDATNSADKVAKGRQAKGASHGFYKHPERAPRGERAGCARLTADQVRQIRRLYATGQTTYPELGARFGVAAPTIQHVVNRRTWAHVE